MLGTGLSSEQSRQVLHLSTYLQWGRRRLNRQRRGYLQPVLRGNSDGVGADVARAG